jgi:hypothetical protein
MTTYQAVFLDNGQVFFGRVESLDRHYITLVDVFYVQTVTAARRWPTLSRVRSPLKPSSSPLS